MLEDLNKRLMDVKLKMRMKQKLVGKVRELEFELSKAKTKLEELNDSLIKEGQDVEKLEGLSLIGLFYTVLGNKVEQLEKERQEYLLVKLKFDEYKDSVTLLENDLLQVKSEISSLGDVEADYQVVFEEKEKIILRGTDTNAKKILHLAENIADINSNIKELKEALSTGKVALAGLNDVIDSLQSAEGWGTWDLLGGGLLSTAIKHSRIDDARDSVHKVQHQLRIFQKKLNDVDPNFNSEVVIEIGSFATFADYFFDGLITDWIVQSRISDSLQNAVNVRDNVILIINSLKGYLEKNQQELDALEEERRVLVESVG